jgi:hypothetical protein
MHELLVAISARFRSAALGGVIGCYLGGFQLSWLVVYASLCFVLGACVALLVWAFLK